MTSLTCCEIGALTLVQHIVWSLQVVVPKAKRLLHVRPSRSDTPGQQYAEPEPQPPFGGGFQLATGEALTVSAATMAVPITVRLNCILTVDWFCVVGGGGMCCFVE